VVLGGERENELKEEEEEEEVATVAERRTGKQ
jgi:hypothetical protein